MKKLLSAVTSLAMSASVATSALSSMNVSAAGGSSAVQPNVSMGDILDVSAMKTADVPSAVLQKASDIKVFPEKDVYEVKAGDTIKELSLMIDAGSHSVGMYALEFDTVPNGFTISNPSKVNLAAQDTAWQTVGNAYYCNSIGGGGDPIKPSTSDPIFYFDLAVGSNVAPGEYTLNLKRVDTIESTSNGYTATVQPIKIKVAGPATTAAVTNAPAQNNPTQAPATQAPATQGSQTPAQSPAQSQLKLDSSFKFFPEKDLYTAKAGDTVKDILMMVEPGNHSAGMYALEFDSLPSGFTLVKTSKTNEAAEDTAWNKVGDVYFNNSLNGGDPIKPSTEDPLFYFDLQIASTVPDGVYTINFKRLDVIESPESSFTAATTPVKIQVGNSSTPVVTNAPATNAPATNAPAQGNQPAAQNPTTSDKQLAVNSEFKLFPEKDNYEIKAGSTQKEILLFVEPGTHSSGMYALEFGDLPAGFTMKNPSKTNEAAEDTAWNKVGDVYYNNSLNGGDPIKPSTEDPLFYFDLDVANTVAPGEYTIPIKRLDVIESQDKQFGAAVTPVKVTVTNGGTVTPTSATPSSATPTNAQNPSTSDFVVKPGTYNVKAGEDVDVEVMVENGGHNPGMYAVEFDSLPDGITMKKFDGINLAQDDSPWKANGSTYNCNSLAAGGDPVTFNASEPIMTFKLSTSKDLKPGDYEFTFKRFHVVDSKTVEYDAKVEKGIIRITSDATDAPATTPTQATPTNAPTPTPTSAPQQTPTNAPQQTPTNPGSQTPAASGSVAWDIADKVPAKAGSTVEVPIKVSGNGDLTVAGAQFKVKAAKGSLSSAKTPSVYADAVEFNTNTNEIAFGNGTGAGSAVKDGDAVATLVISVPAGTPAGEYAVDFDKDSFLCVVDGNGNDITSKVTLTNGSILVGDVATGTATWDIADKVPAKAGEKVDVQIKVSGNSDLAVSGAQFKIKPDTATFDGAKGPSAYSTEVEGNKSTSEVAFGNGSGDVYTGKDGDAVVTITLDVPAGTPAGEYPVDWVKDSFLQITGANGEDVTDKVTLTGGSILVGDVATGTATWDIADKVPAKAGEKVDVQIKVSGNSDLGVSGAQFKIKPDTATFDGAKGPSAYSTEVEGNKSTSEVAFGNGSGDVYTGKDGAAVVTITLDVPAGTPAGEYPVDWVKDSFLQITGANGEDVTDKVTLTGGSILVGDVATGTATWDIADKVPAKAGEKVDVQIKVVGDSDLGVSGAQFKIKPDTATFDSAKGPSVYSVTVEGNKATSEVAFGNGSGEVYTAKDGDAVVTITLDVPAGTPAGEYPVDWVKDAFLQITGANGADVTDKVTLTGGSIIIEDPNVTTTAPSTDTTPVDTTAVTPGTDTTPVDTTAVTPGTDTTPVDTTAVTPGTETTPVDTTVVTPGTDTTPVQTDEQGNPVTTPAGTDTTPVQTDEQGNPVTTPVGTDTTPVNPTTAQGGDVTATTSVAGTGQSGQTVTVPAGAIVWQLNNTKAKPGETVTLTMSVKDPNGTKLPVGGAQFVLTPNGASLVGADGKPYTNDLEVNTNTNEFAFGAFDGTADVLNDGDQILTVSYKVPDNAKLGDIIPINFSGLTVVDEKGNDITKSVVTIDGYIEIVDNTTTAPVQTDENGNPVTSPAGTDTTPVQTDEHGNPVTSPAGTDTTPVQTDEHGNPVTSPAGTDTTPVQTDEQGNPVTSPAGTDTTPVQTDEQGNPVTSPAGTDTTPVQTDEQGNPVTSPAGTDTTPVQTDEQGNPVTSPAGTDTTPVQTDEQGNPVTSPAGTDTTPVTPGTDTTPVDTTPVTPGSTTAPVTPTTPPTTTHEVQQGAIVWQLDNVKGKPGETVKMTMTVNDPNGSRLSVGGGQFILVTPDGVQLVGADGTPYGKPLEVNKETGEFAFGENGLGTVLPDGSVMLTVEYKIPENAAPGTKIPVTFKDLQVTDEFGNPLNVIGIGGSIEVLPPDSTTEPTPGTTLVDTTPTTPVDTTPTTPVDTTPTTPVDTTPTTPVDTTPTTPVDTTPTTPVDTTPTTPVDTTPTTPVDTTPTTPVDTTPTTPVDTTPTTPVDTTPTTPVDTTPTTPVDTTPTTPVDTTPTTPVDTTPTTPVDTTPTTPVDTTPTTPVDTTPTTPVDTTPTTPGTTDTTPTGPVTPSTTSVYAVAEVNDGYYFNHDPRAYSVTNHIKSLSLKVVNEDGTESDVPLDMSKITFSDSVNGSDVPMDTYREDQVDHTYTINVLYEGKPLLDKDGNAISFKVFIGVKGDANLDNKVDAGDATNVLVYYSALSTGGDPEKTILAGESCEAVKANPELDNLAAFLADVDLDVYSEGNWNTKKSGRKLLADDATTILVFYSTMSTGETNRYKGWNSSLAGREENMNNSLTAAEVAKALAQGGKN